MMVNPVTVWGSETPTVAPTDAQAAADYLYNAFVKAFQSKFKVVDAPGPGVLQIQVALTNAQAATPVLRTVSMAVPQARVLATLKYAATGTSPSSGRRKGSSKCATLSMAASSRPRSIGASVAARSRRRRSGSGLTPKRPWTSGHRYR